MMAVYQIKNTITGAVYIGASIKGSGRLREHRMALLRGKHETPKLQAAWNEHGESAFTFEVIETFASVRAMIDTERAMLVDWMENRPDRLYNRTTRVGSPNSHNSESHDLPEYDGETIKALRERLQLTQTAFAERIGCAQGAVAMWEANQRRPKGLYARAVRALMRESPPPKNDQRDPKA